MCVTPIVQSFAECLWSARTRGGTVVQAVPEPHRRWWRAPRSVPCQSHTLSPSHDHEGKCDATGTGDVGHPQEDAMPKPHRRQATWAPRVIIPCSPHRLLSHGLPRLYLIGLGRRRPVARLVLRRRPCVYSQMGYGRARPRARRHLQSHAQLDQGSEIQLPMYELPRKGVRASSQPNSMGRTTVHAGSPLEVLIDSAAYKTIYFELKMARRCLTCNTFFRAQPQPPLGFPPRTLLAAGSLCP